MSRAGIKRTYVSHNKTLNKMKNIRKLLKPALLIGAVSGCILLKSRKDYKVVITEETKKECLQKIFFDETKKQQKYLKKYLEYMNTDFKTALLYADSAKMANYGSSLAYDYLYNG